MDSERAARSVENRSMRLLSFRPRVTPAPASVRIDVAPDVVVFCDRTLRNALGEAGRAWRARSHVPVRLFVAPLAQQAELSRHGARADILAGIGVRQMEAAQRLGAVDPATCKIVGRDPLVLAIIGPEKRAVALAPGANLDRLLDDGRLGIVDLAIGVAGAEARAALAAVELWPALESRSVGAENTDTLVGLLTKGDVRVAAIYRSDIKAHPEISIAATFPTPAPLVLAAITAHVRSPYARRFLAFLVGDGFVTLERAGLDAP